MDSNLPMEPGLKEQVGRFLEQQSTMTLATAGPDNSPFAADLYFVSNSDLDLFFISEPGARHAENISQNPNIAATIHGASWDWRDIKGLQLEGKCTKITNLAQRAEALRLYGQKFKFLPAFSAIITRHNVYQITPNWLRWVDNSVTFGYKQELVIPAGR